MLYIANYKFRDTIADTTFFRTSYIFYYSYEDIFISIKKADAVAEAIEMLPLAVRSVCEGSTKNVFFP
jgi:hypothetical protein